MNKSRFAAPRCPGSLKEGFTTYNPSTLRKLFEGRSVFHVLPEPPLDSKWESALIHESHFGNQLWYRMHLVKNNLIPNSRGGWLLKTVSPGVRNLGFPLEQAANEHFCLQLASQVYEIETVPNALIFFPDGQPAIICKYSGNSTQKQRHIHGYIDFGELLEKNYKELTPRLSKEYSYQHLAVLIDKYSAASLIVKERFFSQVVFSWLIANAEAHMKNFGLMKTTRGDYDMAPMTNVMCTLLHEQGPELAAPGGLYLGDHDSPEFREYGHYTRNEFNSFGRRINLLPERIEKILNRFVEGEDQAMALLEKSFLPEEGRNIIKFNLWERLARLK